MSIIQGIERISDEYRFKEILKAVAIKGRQFRPNDFVWKILERSMDVKTIFTSESVDMTNVSPVLTASFINEGQILPVWVEPDGRIFDGRIRYGFFKERTDYLVYPGYLPTRKRHEIRIQSSEFVYKFILEK